MSSTVRVKPTELKTVISLLEAEHPDVEDLAREVITELKTRWLTDDMYVVIMYDPNTKIVIPFGPYGTKKQAEKGLNQIASPGPLPAQGIIALVREIDNGG